MRKFHSEPKETDNLSGEKKRRDPAALRFGGGSSWRKIPDLTDNESDCRQGGAKKEVAALLKNLATQEEDTILGGRENTTMPPKRQIGSMSEVKREKSCTCVGGGF